jgi:hypothetical protein
MRFKHPILVHCSTPSYPCIVPLNIPPAIFKVAKSVKSALPRNPRAIIRVGNDMSLSQKKKEYSPCRDFREEPPRASPVHAYSILKILRCCRDGEIFGTKQSFMETHCLNIGFRDSLGLLTGSRDSTTRKKRHDGLWIPRSMWTLWISITSRTVQTGIPAAHQRTTY